MKKIANIVFYKFNNGDKKNMVQACLFYNDGTVKNVSYDEAMKESKKIAAEENANGRESFNSLLNNRRIFVMSGEELTRRFDDFVVNDNVKNAIDDALDNIVLVDKKEKVFTKKNTKPRNTTIIPIEYNLINKNVNELNEVKEEKEDIIYNNEKKVVEDTNNESINEMEPTEDELDEIVVPSILPIGFNKKEEIEESEEFEDEEDLDLDEEDIVDNSKPSIGFTASNTKEQVEENEDEVLDELYAMNEKDKAIAPKPVELKSNNNTGTFGRIKNFVRGKILPVSVAAAMVLGGVGIGYALNKAPKEGVMNSTGTKIEQEASTNGNNDEVVVNYANNEYYNGYTFDELLEVTTNIKQKQVMQNVSNALDWFNGTFADAYVEKGKDIRAALTWDEMVALQIAYNDYTKQELHAIFNGAEISSNDLENAYKNATLQLMGAYVIEQEPNLVDVTQFVHDEEGIKFVQKYQNLLEAAKNATGEEKLAAIKAFYSELYKDFPITDEVRTEGISHSDHRTIESYKLAVAPMVAAAEIMFQNYEIDHTLTDKAIDYFNDLGLCNLAQDKFDKVEMITLACCEYDEENPLYEQFKNAKIIELKNKGIYVIDDAHRDLSQLDRFQELVNWHFKMVDGHFELETWYTTETYTTKKTWTEKHTKRWTETTRTETDDRDEAVRQAGEKKVRDAEKKVDKQIEEENRKEKEEAEKKAEETRKEMQEEADNHKKDLEEEVKKDDQDLQKDIDNANDKINNGEKVNEDDFDDHNVHFEDEDKDKDGNLDGSVKDITTDDTGVDQKLPDPNESGKEFDKEGQSIEPEITYEVEEDQEIDRSETPETNNNNDNNSSDDNSYVDLGDPNDFDNNNNNNSDEADYDVEYDEEIDRSEDNKSESKKEKAEPKAESKEEVKKEEPKQESAPKQETKKEEPKAEPKKEAPKAEPKQESAPKAEPKAESAPAKKSNEQAVNDYVEKQAKESNDDDKEKTLVKD